MTDELNFVMAARREKLDAVRAAGIEPFAYSFVRTHVASDVATLAPETGEAPEPARVAGRLVSLRPHGKTTFAHLADAS